MSVGDMRALAADGVLEDRLKATCRVQAHQRIVAGVLSGGTTSLAMLSGSGAASSSATIGFLPGCIAKALTTAVVCGVIDAGFFALDTPVTDLLDDPHGHQWPVLRGVCVRQLLNHTHGFDASSLIAAPRLANQQIDFDALYRAIARNGRVAQPGERYSYGNTGFWLAAAILERLLGRRYGVLLVTRLLEPLGIEARHDERLSTHFCAARGGSLSLTVPDLLRIVRWQISGLGRGETRIPGHDLMPGSPVPLPGWGLEQGAGLGWQYYGEGWFGHTALLPETSVCVRFNIEQQTGIALATDTRSVALVLARLCGRMLPEFKELKVPRPLATWGPNEWQPDRCTGVFRNASMHVSVHDAAAPTLQLSGARSTLRPCVQGVFLLEPPHAELGQWVQFLEPGPAGYRYLWNGKELLPRQPA